MAPPAKTSGYVASMAAAMAPPADSPVTKTRSLSNPCDVTIALIICRIEWTSPSHVVHRPPETS